jgi:hypothetical protein
MDGSAGLFCIYGIGMFVLPVLGVLFLQWYMREMDKEQTRAIREMHKRFHDQDNLDDFRPW